jgi:UDP-N-acetylmuramate--alanine ligase
VQITQACQEGWHVVFSLNIRGVEYADIEASLIGTHNVLNAAAVFGLCLALGVPEDSIRDAFISFEGIGRRVEKKGEAKTISIYDDYAHHPTEIMTTLKALKEVFAGKRLVVAFQPHRYTRTRDCLNQFPEAFAEADALILADIYSAGEAPIEGVTNEVLLEKIRNKIKEKVNFVPRQQMVSFLSEFLKPNDILVTMGAGDVTRIGPDLLAFLSE